MHARAAFLASLTAGDAVAFVVSSDSYDRLTTAWVVRRTSSAIFLHINGSEVRLNADGYVYGRRYDTVRRVVAAPIEGVDAYNDRCSRGAAAMTARIIDRAARIRA